MLLRLPADDDLLLVNDKHAETGTTCKAVVSVLLLTLVTAALAQGGNASEDFELLSPNPVANYRGLGDERSALLPSGFDFNRAGIVTASGESFPNGRQLTYLKPLHVPDDGIDRTRLLGRFSLEELREIEVLPGVLNVVLSKSMDVLENLPGLNPDFDVEELWEQADANKLEGPFTLWVDEQNVLTRLSTARTGANGVRPTYPQFACVANGVVVGSVAAVIMLEFAERFASMTDACLSGVWGDHWSPQDYATDEEAPPLRLANESGETVVLGDFDGSTLLLAFLAPLEQEPIRVRDTSQAFGVPEPAPKVRVAQLQDVISESDTAVELIVVGVDSAVNGELWQAQAVSEELEKRLDVEVFTDSDDVTQMNYLQFGSSANTVVLLQDGDVVEVFQDLNLLNEDARNRGASLSGWLSRVGAN